MAKTAHSSYQALALAMLGRDEWFSKFPPGTRDRFIKEGKLVTLNSGETFCRHGEPIDFLCVVIEGTLDVSTTGASGKRHIWSCLGPGQVMNLIPALDDQPSIHDASARGETTVLLIPKQVFLRAVDEDPAVARQLMRLLCLRSRVLYESASDNALLNLRARCARALLSLMASYGLARHNGVAITLKLSQDEFADMLGRTRQSVNRELKTFEREGFIEMTYSHFIIRNEQALKRIVAS